MEVRPDGRVGYALSPHGSADYGAGYYEKARAGRAVALGPTQARIAPESLSIAGPEERPLAPPHAGFRTLHADYGHPRHLEFTVPSGGPGGTSSERVPLDLSRVRSPSTRIGPTEGSLDACGYLASEVETDMWPQEDALCFGALAELGEGPAFRYDSQSTLDTLAKFVWSLNSERPRIFHFDTVFMDYGMYLHLFGQDGRTRQPGGMLAYENLARLWGMTFLFPDGMPPTWAFVTSSRQGPIFANGPHTTRCTSAGLDVTHHCALVGSPEPHVPDLPWGFRVRPEFR